MKKMMFALLGLLFFPVVSIALESEATSNKAPLNVADIWSFEKDSYKEYGPRREDAFDNIFDIDVYINNAPDDDAPWLARHLDGRPLEKITDEDGRKGFRIPAGFSQPSRTLDNMWFVDVEIMGASPEASMESAIKSWPELDSTVINFQQRIYFGQFDSFSLTMHMTFEGESVIEETTVHEVEGAATTVGVDLNMRSYEDTKNILAARNPPASEDLFGEAHRGVTAHVAEGRFTLNDNKREKQLVDECLLGLFDLGHLAQSGLYYVIHERKVPANIEG